jgi:hypothetical protein
MKLSPHVRMALGAMAGVGAFMAAVSIAQEVRSAVY